MRSVKILAIIAIGFAVLFLIFFIYDIFRWNQIRMSPTETTPVSRADATTNFTIAFIMAIMSLVLIGIAVYYLVRSNPLTKIIPTTATTTVTQTLPRAVVRDTIIEKQDVVPLYELNQPSVLYTRLR